MIESINEWFLGLGAEYGVNPYIFGAIWVGAIPFFLATIAWMVRRKRQGKSVALQVSLAGFLAMSSYIYLIIAGRNLAWWVYAIIAGLILYSVYSLIKKVREPEPPAPSASE